MTWLSVVSHLIQNGARKRSRCLNVGPKCKIIVSFEKNLFSEIVGICDSWICGCNCWTLGFSLDFATKTDTSRLKLDDCLATIATICVCSHCYNTEICKWATEKKRSSKIDEYRLSCHYKTLTADALCWPNRCFFFALLTPKWRQWRSIPLSISSASSVCVSDNLHIICFVEPVSVCKWWILFTIPLNFSNHLECVLERKRQRLNAIVWAIVCGTIVDGAINQLKLSVERLNMANMSLIRSPYSIRQMIWSLTAWKRERHQFRAIAI